MRGDSGAGREECEGKEVSRCITVVAPPNATLLAGGPRGSGGNQWGGGVATTSKA